MPLMSIGINELFLLKITLDLLEAVMFYFSWNSFDKVNTSF